MTKNRIRTPTPHKQSPELSSFAEADLRRVIVPAMSERWQSKNAAAIDNSNRWADTRGLLPDRHRQFGRRYTINHWETVIA
jgi:hypothetical protein